VRVLVAVCEAKLRANCGEPEVAVSPRLGRKMDCTCAAAYGVTPSQGVATRKPLSMRAPTPLVWKPA